MAARDRARGRHGHGFCAALACARSRGAQTFALPGSTADFGLEPPSAAPFVCQELIEILYHTLWETVHVFFEHAAHPELSDDRPTTPGPADTLGATAFLYPFLGSDRRDPSALVDGVAASIQAKAADERLREQTAREEVDRIAAATSAIVDRVRRGGKLLVFGNGGSATDANDWALDCVAAARSLPAVSLAMEPASITAITNDIGAETIFLRQLIAHGRPPTSRSRSRRAAGRPTSSRRSRRRGGAASPRSRSSAMTAARS